MESKQKLIETTFSDLIKPSMDLLNQVHIAVQAGNLDLPPLDADAVDISKMCDTSEKDLDRDDGTLQESVQKESLQEASSNERTYLQMILDFAAEGNANDYSVWKSWASQQPDAEKAAKVTSSFFRRTYDSYVTDKPVAATGAAEPANVQPNKDYQMSDNLKNLLSITKADADYVETPASTVADKYETIDLLLRRVVRGKSSKRYYLLAGDAGIGKTYTVAKILEEEGKADIDSITYTGSIGRSVTAIAQFLWEHRDDDILVLDDCDSFLRKDGNPDVINILKGCMEPGTGHKVGIPTNIAAKITRLANKAKNESKVSDKVKALLEGEVNYDIVDAVRLCWPRISEAAKSIIADWYATEVGASDYSLTDLASYVKDNFLRIINNYAIDKSELEVVVDELISFRYFSADDLPNVENLDDEIVDEPIEAGTLDTVEVVPTSWVFNAKLIIISNLHEKQINEALWSRCDHFDLHLTQEEYLVRLAMIIDGMDIGQKAGICTDQEAKEAKALVLSVMQAVIEAGNNGVRLFGKYVKLSEHLEFRMVKDLANTWIAMLERDQELHPEKDIEQSKTDILERWMRISVIPRLSYSQKA